MAFNIEFEIVSLSQGCKIIIFLKTYFFIQNSAPKELLRPSSNMRVFTNNSQKNYCKNLNEPCSTSRFLIPEIHMELLRNRLKKHDNSLSNYLSYLLNRYRFLIKNGLIPKHEYLKTSYQEKDLNLKKIDFIPKAEDWAEMKCLRSFFNRSMTSIFVFLLLLDALDLPLNLPKKLADFVVPKISHFRQEVKIQFSRKNFLYSRIFRITRDKAG